MKTVFNNSQCAHIWAQQSQSFGRSDNMEFDGAVIKSYQTPIAAFVPSAATRRGGLLYRAVLITSDGYSATTKGRHRTAVHSAVRGTRSFVVPDIGFAGGRASTLRVGPGSDFKSYKAVHKANLAWLVSEYRKEVARLLRSVSGDAIRLQQLQTHARRIADYRTTFAVAALKRDAIDLDVDSMAVAARWARLAADPKRQARVDESERAAGILRASQLSENTAKWRAHEYHGTLDTPTALLRVTRPGTHVQTSWGATITVDEARHFAKFWAANRNGGWSQRFGTLMVDGFPLRDIAPGSGDVVIGCHKIAGSEIEATAAALAALAA